MEKTGKRPAGSLSPLQKLRCVEEMPVWGARLVRRWLCCDLRHAPSSPPPRNGTRCSSFHPSSRLKPLQVLKTSTNHSPAGVFPSACAQQLIFFKLQDGCEERQGLAGALGDLNNLQVGWSWVWDCTVLGSSKAWK